MFKLLILLICILFPANGRADDGSLLNAYYSTIVEKHAEPIFAEKIVTDSLSGLSNIDKNLYFADGKKMLYLYYKRRQVALWHRPQDFQDVKIWSEIAQKVINAAIKYSPQARTRDYEVIEQVMTAGAQSLDDHSRYYSDPDFAEDETFDGLKTTRLFGKRMIEDILYIKVGSFTSSTPKNIRKVLNENRQAKGIILDFRGNKGGLLTSAIDTAGLFIDGGIVASVKGRDNSKVKYYNTPDKEVLYLPLAVLIDADTASSAEVVASALSEQAQAKLIGTNSFGKGSIQELYRFENDGELALTTAYFYTPSGKKIDKVGLVPDYCTYGAQDGDAFESVSLASQNCKKEKRSEYNFDIDFAVFSLKNTFSIQ